MFLVSVFCFWNKISYLGLIIVIIFDVVNWYNGMVLVIKYYDYKLVMVVNFFSLNWIFMLLVYRGRWLLYGCDGCVWIIIRYRYLYCDSIYKYRESWLYVMLFFLL